jgi:ABC-type antimicrobial peptide transport system permease subunit
MIIPTHIRIAWASLRSTPIRTGLTTLGIIIGVASITLVLALSQGAKDTLTGQVSQLDEKVILVKPGRQDQRDAFTTYNPYAISTTSSLTERDFKSVSADPGIDAVAPLMFLSGTVKNNSHSASAVPIIATNTSLMGILELPERSGQFLDSTTNRNTVVLGYDIALDLLGTDQARGQEIFIKGRAHTVIGVMKRIKNPINLLGVNLDRAAYVSLADGKSFNQGIAQIQQMIIRTKDTSSTPVTAAAIDRTIISNHDGERDFSVLEGKLAADSANSFYSTLVMVTSLIAGISLLVGGIGIMNVMLVGVTERTREIGIRKALGATDSQILIQFIIEALIMTITGGIIGLCLAYAGAFLVGLFLNITPAISWGIVGTALGLSTLVGLLFGTFPAVRAAKKDPITALRQYQ